jgi:hypothetical protein
MIPHSSSQVIYGRVYGSATDSLMYGIMSKTALTRCGTRITPMVYCERLSYVILGRRVCRVFEFLQLDVYQMQLSSLIV